MSCSWEKLNWDDFEEYDYWVDHVCNVYKFKHHKRDYLGSTFDDIFKLVELGFGGK